MSAPIQSSAAPAKAPASELRPSLVGALRGVGLLTWRTQLTWRRLPRLLFNLLLLPALVYLTISPIIWARRETGLGNAMAQLHGYTSRASRSGHPLGPEQSTKLLTVFVDEFKRAERGMAEEPVPKGSPRPKPSQVLDLCYDRIQDRAGDFLDYDQRNHLRRYAERQVEQMERRQSQPFWSPSSAYYHWLIDFYFFVLLPLTCIAACGGLIREELQANTLGFLVTRPLTRATLVLTKYLSHTAWLQLLLLIEAGLLFGVGGVRHISGLASLAPLFLFAQVLAVFAWSALGTFLGLVTRRYMALALIYGLIVEMGIGRIPTNINNLSLIRHLKGLLAHEPALQSMYDWQSNPILVAVVPLVVASIFFAVLAALLFTYQEYHHTEEMQK